METKNEITKVEQAEIQIADKSPVALIMAALKENPELDIEKFDKILEFQVKYDAIQAKKAFVAAMAAFKANPPKIVNDCQVSYKQTKYSHASLSNIVNQISSSLSENGLTASWKTDTLDNGAIKVTCVITHQLGHSEETSLPAMPDTTGSKNAIQAQGSAVTYLKRYTLMALLGLVIMDEDDDGNGAGNGNARKDIPKPNDHEQGIIERICEDLPEKDGFTPNIKKITGLFVAKTGAYPTSVKCVSKASKWLMDNHGDTELYTPVDSQEQQNADEYHFEQEPE